MSLSACIDADVDAAPDSGSGGLNCIEHHVSKMDTLAGVAIKYGVEVADIKRMNGLATDLQMFALKKLLIPLPGRHPPSSSLSGSVSVSVRGSTAAVPPRLGHSKIVESCQPSKTKSPPKKTSEAMNMLQNYYGLMINHGQAVEGTEMVLYRTEKSHSPGNGSLDKPSPIFDSHQPRGHRHGNIANNLLLENVATAEESAWRRQKAELDSVGATPKKLLRQENGSSGFTAITGKGLAQRPKSGSRTNLVIDPETGLFSSVQVGTGDSTTADGFTGVNKSPSTPALQYHDANNSGWPTSKWHLKSDLQALSSAAIARPLFDGLWNKAARD